MSSSRWDAGGEYPILNHIISPHRVGWVAGNPKNKPHWLVGVVALN